MVYIAEKQNVSQPDFPHIVVNDIRKALAVISALFYDYPAQKLNMIGITGTDGKTTTATVVSKIIDTNNNEILYGSVEDNINKCIL